MMFALHKLGLWAMNFGYGMWVVDDFGDLVRPGNDFFIGFMWEDI